MAWAASLRLIVGLVGGPAWADGAGEGLASAGARTFLLGGDLEYPNGMSPAPGDVILTGMPWVNAVASSDPRLRVAMIVVSPQGASALDVLGPFGLSSQWEWTGDVPAGYRVPNTLIGSPREEIQSFGQSAEIAYRPADDLQGFLARCWIGAPNESVCEINATYPADDHTMVSAVWQGNLPGQGVDLYAMAERLREIAECLDVTDDIPVDPAARLAEVQATHPTLEDCDVALVS